MLLSASGHPGDRRPCEESTIFSTMIEREEGELNIITTTIIIDKQKARHSFQHSHIEESLLRDVATTFLFEWGPYWHNFLLQLQPHFDRAWERMLSNQTLSFQVPVEVTVAAAEVHLGLHPHFGTISVLATTFFFSKFTKTISVFLIEAKVTV